MSSASRHITLTLLLAALPLAVAPRAFSQATGDSRTVTEPLFPAFASPAATSCSIITAESTVHTVSGKLEPTSETLDTAIQSALTTCGASATSSAPGYVELTTNTNGNVAFVIPSLSIPSYVTLQVDAGVTVFGSLDPCDYQVGGSSECWNGSTPSQTACGTLHSSSNTGDGCHPLIRSTSTTGAAVVGYGVIDGRGGDALLNSDTSGDTIVIANVPNHTLFTCSVYSFWCVNQTAHANSGYSGQIPMLLNTNGANSFTVYKISLKDPGQFTFLWSGINGTTSSYQAPTDGLTVWGVKIAAPSPTIEVNTDGIDPANNVQDVTIANSYISNGDDNIAVSSNAASATDGSQTSANTAKNISILNMHMYSGLGVSIGSEEKGGVSNMLVNGLYESGNTTETQQNGFSIKSDADRGGIVNNITYENVCMQNQLASVRFYPDYDGGTPPNYNYLPTFTNILLKNVHVLANPSTSSGLWEFRGYNGPNSGGTTTTNIMTATMDNVVADGTVDSTTHATDYTTLTLGPDPVSSYVATGYPSLASIGTGNPDMTIHNDIGNSNPAFACANNTTNFPNIVIDTFVQHGTDNGADTNLQAVTRLQGQDFTLVAVVTPTTSNVAVTGGGDLIAPPVTGTVQFMDMNNSPATPVTLPPGVTVGRSANGTTFTLTLNTSTNNYPTGVHRFGAEYIGTDYPSDTAAVGNVIVTVNP